MNAKTKNETQYVKPNAEAFRRVKDTLGVTWDKFEAEVCDGMIKNIPASLSGGWRVPLAVVEAIADVSGEKVEHLCDMSTKGGRRQGRPQAKEMAAAVKQEPLKYGPTENSADAVSEHIDAIRQGLEALERHHVSYETAAERYRELVGVFSKDALSHAEAVRKLRAMKHDADRFAQMKGLLS